MLNDIKDTIDPPKLTSSVKKKAAAEKIKEAEVAPVLPKKSKLAVRVVGRQVKTASEPEVKKPPVIKKRAVKKIAKEDNFFYKINRERPEKETVSSLTGEEIITPVAAEAEENNVLPEEQTKEPKRPIGLYRQISIFFVILTLGLLAAAFYFFFLKLTVEVTPKTERITDKINFTVLNGANNAAAAALTDQATVVGSVEKIPVKDENTYPATGENILGQEITGKVSIINNYSQSKTLVATTRLLTADGKLFRIKDRVEIPAGGSATVDIYTDEPSQEMAIGPTTFTIPGLWAGLQDKIYAKSSEAFVYTTNIEKFVQDADLEKAKQDAQTTLTNKVQTQFAGNYKGFDKVIAQIDSATLESSSSVKVKEKVAEFKVSISAEVTVVAWQSADAEKIAKDKLISAIPADQNFVSLDAANLQYDLTGADTEAGTATLEASFTGTSRLSDAGEVVDKTKLVNLSEAQINNYLSGLDKFSDFKLTFFPSFIKKAPSLVDRINVIIK